MGKCYGEIPVFSGLSFSLSPGEAVGIVGPNGAGKSTLLRCVVGTEFFDEGSVEVEGAKLDESSPSLRAAVASLLDGSEYFPELSVVEHLRLVAWAHGAADADLIVDGVVNEVGLDAVRDQLPATLSSGERHRLGLASCLVRPRRILILDEPEQRLDAAGRAWLAGRLQVEKEAGIGVVFASHDGALIDSVADRIVDVAP